ncbi:MAG: TlpA family protein disulfide reductase [Nitrospirae bacterium]|nr:TlpA family protein disulfide reductase [Candidatus Troglogloeales bacterium]
MIFFLCFLWLTACSNQSGVDIGQVAPEFTLKSLRGDTLSLSAFRGKVVLINFWATWCDPCKAEMPSMETLYRHYKRDDFEILAVSIDTVEENNVRDFVERFHFTFPVVLDNQFIVNQVYDARVVPTSVLIDRKGIIRERILGARNWSDADMRLLANKLILLK